MNLAAQTIEPAELPPGGFTSLRGMWLDRKFLVQAISLFVLLGLLYGHVVAKLVRQWSEDPNYTHGFFVPVCAGMLLWIKRKSWLNTTLQPSLWGAVPIVAAMGLLVIGTLGAELFLP